MDLWRFFWQKWYTQRLPDTAMLLVETCSLVFLPAKYQEKEASASREIAKLTGWFEDFMMK